MRDGVKLFTSVYSPKEMKRGRRSGPDSDGREKEAAGHYPILLYRTPYGVGPYGEDEYRERMGPSEALCREGYIFVYQDVRGRMMSEGSFEAVRPHIPQKTDRADVDESSDTYDTVEWLLEHVANHNGRVGLWGISAPGFYATHALIDAHPAVKAVSPQA
ncbi:MAG: CocE/NonD family hydrolase, partial [Rhodothermales bacterium]